MRENYSQYHTQWEITKNFPTKIRNKTRLSTFTTSVQHSTGSLTHTNQTRKKKKASKLEKRKLSLFTDDMIVYIENPIDSTKKLDLVNECVKTMGIKSIFRNQGHFCAPTIKYQTQKSRKKIPFDKATRKIKVPRNNTNHRGKRLVLRKLHNTRKKLSQKQMEAHTMLMGWKN